MSDTFDHGLDAFERGENEFGLGFSDRFLPESSESFPYLVGADYGSGQPLKQAISNDLLNFL